jgi:hypothetical protein
LCNKTDPYEKKSREVFSESFPPENVIKILENQAPDLINRFKVRSTFRAAFDGQGNKYIRADGFADELLKIAFDSSGKQSIEQSENEQTEEVLSQALDRFLEVTKSRQPENWTRSGVKIDDDLLRKRLRNLGYLE